MNNFYLIKLIVIHKYTPKKYLYIFLTKTKIASNKHKKTNHIKTHPPLSLKKNTNTKLPKTTIRQTQPPTKNQKHPHL